MKWSWVISLIAVFFPTQELIDAVMKEDVPLCILLLAYCTPEDLNEVTDDKGGCSPLHISCSLGNIVLTQLLIWVRDVLLFILSGPEL